MISNYLSMDVKPGSMGRPLPGIGAGIVARAANGAIAEIEAPLRMGELALRAANLSEDVLLPSASEIQQQPGRG